MNSSYRFGLQSALVLTIVIAVGAALPSALFGNIGHLAVFGAIALLITLYIAFRVPYHFFLFFLVFVPVNVYLLRFSQLTLGPFNPIGGIKDVLFLILIFSAVSKVFLSGKPPALKDSVSLLLVIYLAWAAFEAVRNDILFGLVALRIVAEFALAYPATKLLVNESYKARALIYAIILGGIFAILLGLSEVTTLSWAGLGVNPVAGRLTGVFTQVNMYGVYLGIIFTMGAITLFEGLIARKWLPIIFAFQTSALLLLILTFSRRAWVAVFLAIGIWAIVRFRPARIVKLLVLLMLLAVGFLFVDWQLLTGVSLLGSVSSRLAPLFSSNWQADISLGYRLEETRYLLSTIMESPVTFLVGEGLGTFGSGFRTIVGRGTLHNSFLAIWIEMGIVGLGIFLSIVGITIYRAISIVRTNSEWSKIAGISLATLLVILISALFGDMIGNYPFNLFLWLLVGIINICYQKDSRTTVDKMYI